MILKNCAETICEKKRQVMSNTKKPQNVDEYINDAPAHAQQKLHEIRLMLKSVTPNASEELKWGHPVFIEKRILFSYSSYKNHLTFMPTGPAIDPFRSELADYKTGKDTIQFPYDIPLPIELIKKIATY